VRRGEPVQFVREPLNQWDPNAVAIVSLASGLQLGYVPKERTAAFAADGVCGRVASVGAAGDSGLLGCILDVRPGLPSLTLPVLPPGLEHAGELGGGGLGPQDAQQLAGGALREAGGRCQVTGMAAGEGAALVVVPQWHADAARRALVCTGALAVCPHVHAAMQLLGLPAARRGAARELLGLVNWWGEAEVEGYVRHVVRQQQLLRAVPAQQWVLQRQDRPVVLPPQESAQY
jgi:hypothetical protein